jgi:hypothetical protein
VWAAASVSQVFNLVSSALFAFVAGRFFFESRHSGELELLLVTPVGARGILREQRLALLRLLIGPLYLVVFGFIVAAAGAVFTFGERHVLFALIFGLCNMVGSVLGVLAICRVAMWFGTRANSLFAVIGQTVGLVMVAPLVLVYLVPLLLFGTSGDPSTWAVVAAPLLLIKNAFFLRWATRNLNREFRTTERSFLQRLIRWMKAPPTVPLPDPAIQSAPRPFTDVTH